MTVSPHWSQADIQTTAIPKAPRPPLASNQMIIGEDLTDEGDPIKVARNEFLKGCPPKAPSDASHPSFHESQRNSTTQIRCGRPCDPEETIPATLLHPVFGQFLNDCKTHSITAEDNVFVGKFANAMSDVYVNEWTRSTHCLQATTLDFTLPRRKEPRIIRWMVTCPSANIVT